MPNWCYNQIAIILPEEVGTPAERQVRWDILRDLKHHLDTAPEGETEPFSKVLHPEPPELEDREAYRWRCNNWSTKWDMEVYEYLPKHNYVVMNGTTAWGPPMGVLGHLESIGFVVEIQFHSFENASWGCACDSVNTDGAFDMYSGWIDEDDKDDETANEILEFEEHVGRDVTTVECMGYLMEEKFQAPIYNPEFRVLDSRWMLEMFEGDAEQMMESYEEWKEKNPRVSDAKKEFQALREWLLGKVERGNEAGFYNEGQYLEIMNQLKDANLKYLRELWDEHAKKFEMSRFYSGAREHALVKIYA
jgi:hypothetical protein